MGWIVGGLVLGLIVLFVTFSAAMAWKTRKALNVDDLEGRVNLTQSRKAFKETPPRAFGGKVPRKLEREASEFMANYAKARKA